jgi:choline dehydrogenase-like flavoprotein
MGRPRSDRHEADVAVVGGGLAGSVVACSLASRGARVVVADAGTQMSAVAGTHLRNLPACQAERAFYAELLGASLRPAASLACGLPAARRTAVAGGMGALWSCVAPRLHPQLEQWDGISPTAWDDAYGRAERLLAVGHSASAGSRRQAALLALLRRRLGPLPRPAPVAAGTGARPRLVRWTGPAEVRAAHAGRGGSIAVLSEHVVSRLRHRGGRVHAVEAVASASGARVRIAADAFVVAAGAVATPALLWASDVMREDAGRSPLGRGLYEHPLAHAQIQLPRDLVRGLTDVPAALARDPDPFVLVPVAADRPFHGLVVCDATDNSALEGRVDDGLLISLYWYVRGRPAHANRLVLEHAPRDALGLPRPRVAYALERADRALQRRALEDLRAVAASLGQALAMRPPQIRGAGSSMHLMGTTGIGRDDDGRSVADVHGRVWGFSNLYVAGTGLISWPTATNPTLAACALAVRSADRIAAG